LAPREEAIARPLLQTLLREQVVLDGTCEFAFVPVAVALATVYVVLVVCYEPFVNGHGRHDGHRGRLGHPPPGQHSAGPWVPVGEDSFGLFFVVTASEVVFLLFILVVFGVGSFRLLGFFPNSFGLDSGLEVGYEFFELLAFGENGLVAKFRFEVWSSDGKFHTGTRSRN